jgi:hypothetical protein
VRADVDAFYSERSAPECAPGDILVLSVDGKGIVMRPEALRGATKKVAEDFPKLKGRLSRGEKRGRKRMAEIGAVYDVVPVPRNPIEVMASSKDDERVKGPEANHKWLTASVLEDAAPVIGEVFDEAERRDPSICVPGSHSSMATSTRSTAPRYRLRRKIDVTIIIDLIHVLEYL